MSKTMYCIEKAKSVVNKVNIPVNEFEWDMIPTQVYYNRDTANVDRIKLQKDDNTHLYRVNKVKVESKLRGIIRKYFNI